MPNQVIVSKILNGVFSQYLIQMYKKTNPLALILIQFVCMKLRWKHV